jgi:hypothetical protein
MKKDYKKPYLLIESFQLNAAVAGSCAASGGIAINYGENKCGFIEHSEGRYEFFNYNNCEVDLTGPEDGYDTICYHGPTLGLLFIAS